jgi:hypothetical protein
MLEDNPNTPSVCMEEQARFQLSPHGKWDTHFRRGIDAGQSNS